MNKTTLFGLLVLLVVLVIPTATAANVTLQFNPQGSSVPSYCNNTTVEIQLNIPAGLTASYGQLGFDYTPACGNIIDRNLNTDIMTGVDPAWSTWNSSFLQNTCWDYDTDWIVYKFWIPKTGPALVTIGNFTIHCNSTSYCVSDLNFSCKAICPQGCINVWDTGNNPVAFNTTNGTFTCGTPSVEVDLNVTDIDVNPNCNTGGDEIFVNQSNEICATVYNAGPGDVAGNFDVCFYDDANSVNMGTATVTGGLLAGANTTVCIYWTPSCANYPGLSGEHPAIGVPATVNATVDCNGAVTESDEGNNTLLLVTEVSANGYKSKNFDCGSADPLELFNGYDGVQFYGGLVYNVSGVKKYPFAPGENQTRIHNITLPPCATGVKDARLYIVGYDYFYNPVPGCLPNLSVDFNGAATFTTPDAMYTDQKAYGTWDTPKWKYAYNVTEWVGATSSDYSVNVENIDPANSTTLLGGILVVVYEGDDCEHIGLWWMEGCDLLSGRTSYCSSTTEATATVGFPGIIPLAIVDNTELITIVDQGMEPGSNMLFNGINVKTDAWDAPTEAYPGSKINVETYGVPTPDLLASGNTVGFQDNGTMGMQANLAFLKITKKSEVVVEIDPCPAFVYPGGNATVNITLRGITDYGSGTIKLCTEPCPGSSAYALIESVGPGDSTVITHSPLGGQCVDISASNTDGLSGDVVFATVTLTPMGNPGDCICLNLTVDTLYDRNYTALQTVVDDCPCCNNSICDGCLCIREDDPPTVSAIADPPLIYNLSCSCPTCTNLKVHATDATGVAGVWVDLTPILGAGCDMVQMTGPDGTTDGDWYWETCADYSSLTPYHLDVMAVDLHGNWNNGSDITLEVQRTGDVNLDNNAIDMGDYLVIAQYTVGLKPAPDLCRSDIVPPASPDGIIDMGDALYVAMYATLNPIPGYPEPGSLCPCPCSCPPCP